MSPEQFTGKALDARSDVYSLGVMTYEMLTSRLPFDADTPWQWATQHMTAQPIPFEVAAPARDIPDGMRDAILRSLSKDREQRQESARQFFAQLSEGQRMTVEQAAAMPKRGTGTAAMSAAPDFSGGAPMTAPAAPIARPMGPGPMAPAVVAQLPPPPPPARAKGGNKGLIIGLATVGAVLLVAIVVVAARSMKPSDDETQSLSLGQASSQSTSIAPQIEGESTAAPNAAPTPTPEGTDKTQPQNTRSTTGSGTSRTGSGTASSASASSTGTTSPTGSSTSTSPTSTKPAGGGACDACISAASSGNVAGAASNYSKCDDASKKTQCQAIIRPKAAGAAQAAVLNGDCTRAKAIAQAAAAMSATSPQLNTIMSKCK
jgi:serine/threonine-protein kinase